SLFCIFSLFFFFSSRRRHTRSDRDWSSDVCSSDLRGRDAALYYDGPARRLDLGQEWRALTGLPFVWAFWAGRPDALEPRDVARRSEERRVGKEGRCRGGGGRGKKEEERVWRYVALR